MVLRGFLALLGLFHLINGVWMIAAPGAWYAATPGVAMTGPANPHFITDIGFAFLASGVGMIWNIRTGKTAATFALAGAVWPALHALFHIWILIVHGFPHDLTVLTTSLVGVILAGLVGFALAWARAKQEGVV